MSRKSLATGTALACLSAAVVIFNPQSALARKGQQGHHGHQKRAKTVLYHLKSGATPEEMAALREVAIKYGFRLDKNILRGKLKRAKGYQWTEGYEKEIADEIRATNAVDYAEVDALIEVKARTGKPSKTPNDPSFGSQWHLSTIGAPTAWNYTTGKKETKVVLCDTGVDVNHPDLKSNLLLPGYNTADDSTDVIDRNGHGTMTAGTLGAVGGNALGVSGVAWTVSILPIKISNLPDGAAYYSDMAECVQRGADQGAKVANLSYDGAESSSVDSAGTYIRSKGGLLVTAAGNYAANLEGSTPDSPSFLIVGSTGPNDTLSSFSNYGAPIDLVAPGEGVETTTLGGGYGPASGTSFSSPITAGVAALIYSLNPNFTPAQVEGFILSTAVDLGAPGEDTTYGRGRLNAGAAVQKAQQSLATPTPSPTATPQPTPVITSNPTPTPTPVATPRPSPTPTPRPATPTPSPTPSPTPRPATPTPTPTPKPPTPTPTPVISVPSVPVTVEAENMETKTAGGGYSGVWNLWSNGYIENRINFPSTGAYDVKVIAYGTKAASVGPNMDIRVNGTRVAGQTVSSTTAATYTFRINVTAGIQRLAIAYTNDLNANGEDRNLIVDKVTVTAAPAPTPAPTPTTVVIDNAPANVQDSAGGRTFTGAWCKSSQTGYYGVDALQSCGSTLDSYRFTPKLLAASYDVYVRWTSSPSRSVAVPVLVRHSSGTATKSVNQQLSNGTWTLIGRYTFTAGTAGYVEINDSKGEASADAVRFVPVP